MDRKYEYYMSALLTLSHSCTPELNVVFLLTSLTLYTPISELSVTYRKSNVAQVSGFNWGVLGAWSNIGRWENKLVLTIFHQERKNYLAKLLDSFFFKLCSKYQGYRTSPQALELRTPLFPHLVPPTIMVWIFVWKYIFKPFIHILQQFMLQLSRSTNFCF